MLNINPGNFISPKLGDLPAYQIRNYYEITTNRFRADYVLFDSVFNELGLFCLSGTFDGLTRPRIDQSLLNQCEI